MGYTHYWYRRESIPTETMAAIVADFNAVVLALDNLGVRLGDGAGDGVPEISIDGVTFNGLAACGHAQNSEVVIPWPSQTAAGVGAPDPIIGSWYAGVKLESRICDGDCSYETFSFEREFQPADYQRKDPDYADGLFFVCCKTAFRPYDVAVTAFLIIAKHHLGADIRVQSDGRDHHWEDAKRIVYMALGYGYDYSLQPFGKGEQLLPKKVVA